MRSPVFFFALTLLAFAAAHPQVAETGQTGKPTHSTPEQQQRVRTITHKLEATPLDQALLRDREWARQWVIENPDVRIKVCRALMTGLRRPRYKYWIELNDQLMLSSATFLIEHPDQAGDHLAESVGGMQGVLKAYTSILKTNPDDHAPALEDLLEKQAKGKLADSVRETIKTCNFDSAAPAPRPSEVPGGQKSPSAGVPK